MSRFNVPEYNSKVGENCFIDSNTVKISESCSSKTTNQIQELMKIARPIILDSLTMENDSQTKIRPCVAHEDDLNIFNNKGLNKRCRRSVDSSIGAGGILCYRYEDLDPYETTKVYGSDFNGSIPKMSYCNIKTVNFCQTFTDQHRENNLKYFVNSTSRQEKPNNASNTITYNSNGTQINQIKTANSCGSSFIVKTQPYMFTANSKNINHTEKHDLRSQSKNCRSQNIAFSQKINENHSLHKNGDDCNKRSNSNPKIVNYINDGSLQLIDFNNYSYGNNNTMPIINVIGRKDSIPEGYEPDICDGTNSKIRSPPDIIEDNTPVYQNREETLLPVDFLYSNNCYLPTVNINEARNSISYLNPNIPIVVVKNREVPNNVNINAYPQYCLPQLLPYSSDNISLTHSNGNEQNLQHLHNADGSEYLLLQNDSTSASQLCNPIIKTEITQKTQHLSSNDEFNNVTNDQEFFVNKSHLPTEISADIDVSVKTVGKFTVTTTKDNDKMILTLNLSENTEDANPASINTNKEISNENLNKNTNSDNQQPRSRFKKTRIRETIERWHINGLNTYDCRFKVIPSKIMNLKDKTFDHISNEYQLDLCKNCGDHDSGFSCYSSDYNSRVFRFWDNGDRIAICGKLDCETDKYCQFHAKYLKFLNQNQNISLSKFEPQSLNTLNLTLSSSPQIIRAVMISSPENENYTTNIDINVSQNIALSAPPVSPSIMNSAPTTSVPHNLHSPQSSASMAMLRCQTPILLSTASRNTSIMNESISIERINYKSSSRMSFDSENEGLAGQSILLTENNSLADILQNCSTNHDNLQFVLPNSSNCIMETEFIEESFPEETAYNGQEAIYSLGHIPCSLYSFPQQVIPTISTVTSSRRSQEHHQNSTDLEECNLSSNVMQEIDDSLNSLKSMIRNIIKSEQQTLINEIRSLSQANENLQAELNQVKKRSEYLESILKAKNVPIDGIHGNEQYVPENHELPVRGQDSEHMFLDS